MSLDVWLYMTIDTGGNEAYQVDLYEANITHNLNWMAKRAGIYYHLWRPEEIGINKAEELIKPLSEGVKRMKAYPFFYKGFESPNGWGRYIDFVPWVLEYLDACVIHPKALIGVSI